MWFMRSRKRTNFGGSFEFFLICLSHISLASFYQLNFSLKQHHQWNLDEIENMIPWEREIYVTLLKNHIKEQEEEIRLRNNV